MPARSPVPPALTKGAFRSSEALAAGLTRGALRGQRFQRLHHGVRLHSTTVTAPHPHLNERVAVLAQHYSPLLRRGEAFSHTTALLLFGAPLRTEAALHVTARYPMTQARSRGVHGHRTRAAFTCMVTASGLPCVTPQQALTQSSTYLPFRELVVAIDHFIAPRGLGDARGAILDHASLREYFDASHAAGIARLRAACAVARVGAESRFETLLHFELARMGLDSLELQLELYTADGEWIGRFDMVDRATRKIIEFDGEQHRTDRAQYLKDLRRIELARREGYEVLRVHAEDFSPQRLGHTRRELCRFLEAPPRRVPWRLARYFDESIPRTSLL